MGVPSMKVLLTGATGFIGGHVASSLLERGHEVRVLVRPSSEMTWQHPALQVCQGDIRDRISVEKSLEGCDAVVHTAAYYTLWAPDPSVIYDVNVDGTRNVLEAAVGAGVQRIVYTSTVGTIALRKAYLATEDDLAPPHEMSGHYKRSKYEAERIARRMTHAGAPIVIVNPTAPVGPADVKPTPTGQVIVDFLRGRMPAVVDTGLNYVDVADVADGHVLALEKGVPGQRYLLGNVDGNLTLIEMLRRLGRITGLKPPRLRLPHIVAQSIADLDAIVENALLHREPRVPREGVRMAKRKMWVDPSKAVRELGVPQRPIDDALARAARWFVDRGYAPAPPRMLEPSVVGPEHVR
jgi:dihydroflavonol-4-reductase